MPAQLLPGFTIGTKIWGILVLLSLLMVGLAVSSLFWFEVWPLNRVEIFTAFSQVVIAAIAMYAIITKLDGDAAVA